MGGRLVIVPRGDESHSHIVPVMNPGGTSASLNTGPAFGCAASLSDFSAWAGSISTTDVSFPTTHRFMWAVRIERWVGRNCHRDVLANVGNYQSSFRLTFLDGEHKATQFHLWWSQSGKASPDFILAFEDHQILAECIAWTDENILLGHQIVSEYARLGVFVDDENEAVHFKLRWADYIIA